MHLPARGELWWADLAEAGARPVVVVGRDAAVRGRRRALVAPCSTAIRRLPSEVLLEPGQEPVHQRCVVQLDALTDLPVDVLTRRRGGLSDAAMRQVCEAVTVAAGCTG
ncbi:type II toxin-antitoxin system PemK/MazF family toxin [Ornithinimicrobium sufpigmenti]|uniref:type II toxin-antitoxin system PemK/MazF family toxin n=1 Tax=Ornithinimicrobium sufpigmenti TaxID=2508882 RepID=UPI001036B02D|nr:MULTISPECIES: type II toxin-antitoxin system PemK/MazF family toxin [unclassified Ornithinimicrobium]